jgi:hypothetical protein
MTTMTSTPTPADTHPVTLTVSAVPASLPPRAAPGHDTAAPRAVGHRLGAWAPRSRPARGQQAGERAREERSREEERHIRSLARIVALACVEAELGLRPARQLSAWLDLSTYGKMVRRAELARRIRPADPEGCVAAPRALGARCCPAGEGIYEASATIQLPDRVKAMALRIEKHRTRWKVTALELG